jgi:hypothetical protein
MWAIDRPGAKGFSRANRARKPALRGSDLTVIGGKQDPLVGRIQERYGVARHEAERQVETWVNRM